MMSAIVQTDAMLSRTLVTAMSLIEDARAVEHSGVSLHAHLLGTFEILARWGVAEVTQLGGLLHSIYSTQYYHNHLIQRRFRKRVSAQVGQHPERLAYFFGALDRVALREAMAKLDSHSNRISVRLHHSKFSCRISQANLRALLLIDVANEIEQTQRSAILAPQRRPGAWLHHAWQVFQAAGYYPPVLSDYQSIPIDRVLERQLVNTYLAAFHVPAAEANLLMKNCCDWVPFCAEASISYAALLLDQNQATQAYFYARHGVGLLHAWGATWDSRLDKEAWASYGQRFCAAFRLGSPARPKFFSELKAALCNAEMKISLSRG